MFSVNDYIELGAKILPGIFDRGREVFSSKRDKREDAIYEFLAEADILGASAGDLAGKTAMSLGNVETALQDLRRRGQAYRRGGRWYAVSPQSATVQRFAPRW